MASTPVVGAEYLGELYARYGCFVLRRARAILGDEDSAHDALQEVFLRALRRGGRFEPNPLGWLCRAATNLCLNRLRDGERRDAILTSLGPVTDGASDPEQRVFISRILHRVPAELREVALYYHWDGLSHDEIATLIGVSRRTIGNRLSESVDLRPNEQLASGVTPGDAARRGRNPDLARIADVLSFTRTS